LNSEEREVLELIKSSLASTLSKPTLSRESMLNEVDEAVRLIFTPHMNIKACDSKFASKQDLVWDGKAWSIPYVTGQRFYFEDGEPVVDTYKVKWKSLRQAKTWLKRNKDIIYTSFVAQLPGAIKFVTIEGVVCE
jgi:hypothetical protein